MIWNLAILMLAGSTLYGLFAISRASHPRRAIVYSNLDSALENGYFNIGEQLYGASPDEIAYDMTLYAHDCENYRPEELTPYVREWAEKRGMLL